MPYESDPIAIKLNGLVSSLEAYMWLMWFDELAPAEKALIGIWELQQEVYNGGFMQYFKNSSGERAPFISDIARSIGADEVASVLERAISLAGPEIRWSDEAHRCTALNALAESNKDKLSHMSGEFFAQSDELNLLLFRYLSKHRDQIEAPEEFWTEATIQ